MQLAASLGSLRAAAAHVWDHYTMDIPITGAVIDLVIAFLKRKLGRGRPNDSRVSSDIGQHLCEALNWSGRVQFYGMSRAEDTDAATVALTLQVGTSGRGRSREAARAADHTSRGAASPTSEASPRAKRAPTLEADKPPENDRHRHAHGAHNNGAGQPDGEWLQADTLEHLEARVEPHCRHGSAEQHA